MKITERTFGDIVILDIEGDIKLIAEPGLSLSKRIQSLLIKEHRDFLLNFSHVDFIDSNGIGEIVSSFASIKHRDGILKLCNVSEKVMLILKYTRIVQLIEIFDSEEEGLQSFT